VKEWEEVSEKEVSGYTQIRQKRQKRAGQNELKKRSWRRRGWKATFVFFFC